MNLSKFINVPQQSPQQAPQTQNVDMSTGAPTAKPAATPSSSNGVNNKNLLPILQPIAGDPNMNQITRIDGKGCFLEILKDGFNLKNKTSEGKVHLNLTTYDTQSSRQTAFGQFWLSMTEWNVLDTYFNSSEFTEDYVAAVQQAQQQGKRYPDAFKIFLKGGESNGNVISRQLRFAPGQKTDMIVIQYMSGPGVKEGTGIIRPAGKMDVMITVPVTIDAWLGTLKLVNQEIIAHKTCENLRPLLEQIIDLMNMTTPTAGSSNNDLSRLEQKIDTILKEMD